MSEEGVLSWRYENAVRLAAPKIAARTPGLWVDAYWLTERALFFVAEKFEPSIGRICIPYLADAATGTVSEVIPLEQLTTLISERFGSSANMGMFASAQFDMPTCDTLAVMLNGWEMLVDVPSKCVIRAGKEFAMPGVYSPDGRYACFVNGCDIWLKELSSGLERPLTTDGTAKFRYGQQSSVGQDAWPNQHCFTPVGLWSPDSQWFLTHRMDERAVPELPLVQHSPPGGGRPLAHYCKHPIPGDPLPVATLVAVHVASGRAVVFEEFSVNAIYSSPILAHMTWFRGAEQVWVVRLDRYFTQADLIRLDLVSGTGRVVLSEMAASGYLDLHPILAVTPNVRTLQESDEVIWFSERDGLGHLYLYDSATGRLKTRITQGSWQVRDIVHIDEKRRRLLFLAAGIDTEADPGRRSLCAIKLDGSDFQVMLGHDGDVFVPRTEPCGLPQDRPYRRPYAHTGISLDCKFGIVQYSSVERGNRTEVVNLETREGFLIASALPGPDDVPTRHFTAFAADGTTPLHGLMFLPQDFDQRGRYPLIDYIYPGPQYPWKPQSFRSLRSGQAMSLAALGFVTIMLDSRGAPLRSRAFHQCGYPKLLEPQLADHAAVVRQLCEREPFLDGSRVGIFGTSGGGFGAARALCEYGSIFKVGVSVCGNHDNDYNVSSWSDKYRGAGSCKAQAEPPNTKIAHKLEGRLLLICGDMDAHFSYTVLFVDTLIRANKNFDLLIVPNAGHVVAFTSGYTQRRIWDYFVERLLGEEAPSNFEVKFGADEVACFKKRLSSEFSR